MFLILLSKRRDVDLSAALLRVRSHLSSQKRVLCNSDLVMSILFLILNLWTNSVFVLIECLGLPPEQEYMKAIAKALAPPAPQKKLSEFLDKVFNKKH